MSAAVVYTTGIAKEREMLQLPSTLQRSRLLQTATPRIQLGNV